MDEQATPRLPSNLQRTTEKCNHANGDTVEPSLARGLGCRCAALRAACIATPPDQPLHWQGVSWAEIGERVGQRSKIGTADRYSHALVDYREVERKVSSRERAMVAATIARMLFTRSASDLKEGDTVALSQIPHEGVIERIDQRDEGLIIRLQGQRQFFVRRDATVVLVAPPITPD
jgi:hypothetical protein